MKKILKALFKLVKWIVIAALCAELVCFLGISVSNYIIYGTIYEGSRVIYDPYILFQQGPRPTAGSQFLKQNNGTDIWMFGGSTMRGDTENHDNTIPSFLSKNMNMGLKNPAYYIYNWGENSYNSLMETKYLQKMLIENPYSPNYVIFYDGANDSVYFAQHRTPYGHHGYRKVKALIESYHRSFFGLLKPLNAAVNASFTKELYDKLMQASIPIDPDDPELKNHAYLVSRRYDHVERLAGAYNAKFILFWQPVRWVETCPIDPKIKAREDDLPINSERFQVMSHNFKTIYNALYESLKDKPYFVDFKNVLCTRTSPVYKPDGVHLNDDGRAMAARAMAKTLEDRFGLR